MVFRWFLIFLPSLSMVFDGSGPLVKRCDGFDGLLWSIKKHKQEMFLLVSCLLHIVVTVGEDIEKEILLHGGEDRLQIAQFHLRRRMRLWEAAVHVPRLRAGMEACGH